MKDRDWLPLLAAGLVVLAVWHYQTSNKVSEPSPARTPAPSPQPDCPDGTCPKPAPFPVPRPAPLPAPRPWERLEATVGGPRHADGTELAIDLPLSLHQRNTGGSDGAGLCVFASMRHSGLWADEKVFADLFAWMRRHPGGGYPVKVDRMIAQFCREQNQTRPEYIQIESSDLDILRQACQAGLMPAVTYWHSPTGRYGGRRVPHMVSLVHADDQHFAVLDNNFIGSYEWMSPAEFRSAYTDRSTGKGWAIIPLKPGPPPVPMP